MDYISVKGLVPYSLAFACLAFVTMIFVRHGNALKVTARAETDEETEIPENEEKSS